MWHGAYRGDPKPSPPQGDPRLVGETGHLEGHIAVAGMWGEGAGVWEGSDRAVCLKL